MHPHITEAVAASRKLRATVNFATFHHGEQMYGDKPYTYHLLEVWSRVAVAGGCETAQMVAILHDILEDTDCLYEELAREFGVKVARAVLCLTKMKDLPYTEYIKGIRANPIALQVKIADTLCNLTQSHKEGNLKRIRKYSKQMYLLTKED